MPEQLYHYTTNKSFLGILQNKCLWASHILYQNDYSELEYTLDIVGQKLTKLTKGKLNKNALEFVSDILKINLYTVSFSEKADDINQYRSYANSDYGFCIGFRKNVLENIVPKNENIPNINPEITFKKCIYDKDEQISIVDCILNNALKGTDLNQKNIEDVLALKLYKKLREIAAIFKHNAFRGEKEYRLIIQGKNTGKDIRIKERAGTFFFIPYFELEICPNKLIGDVYIGPCENVDQVYASVIQICFNNDMEFCKSEKRKLIKSNIPFRKT